MKPSLAIFLVTLLSVHAHIHAADPAPKAAPKGEVLEFGLFDLVGQQQRVESPATLDGEKLYSDGARFSEQTDRIPATPGVRFGFRYKITGITEQGSAQFKMIVSHPPIKDENGVVQRQHSTLEDLPTKNGYVSEVTGYGLDRPEELVPGVWTFEVWYKGQKMVSQSFTVYVPAKETPSKTPAK